MAATSSSAAAVASLSAIVTPSSELSSTLFSLKPKTHFKPLTLKPHTHTNSTLSPFHHVFLCKSSLDLNFGEIEDDPDEVLSERDDLVDYSSSSLEDCKLFVGNLPYNLPTPELSQLFSEAGNVRNVEIVYDRLTGRSRGFAFVTMGTYKQASKAIQMFDGSQVGGRTVKVNFPEVPIGGEREVMVPKIRRSNRTFVETPHKLYVENLKWNITSDGLTSVFADQPGFMSAKIIYDTTFGRSRGYGFVTFSSAEAAEQALNFMNGMELEGRPLRVNMAEARSNSREQSGQPSPAG